MSILKVLYYISSMKTGLILLCLVGLMAALGSVVSPDIFYNTPLFKLLMILLLINMTICMGLRIIKKPGSLKNLHKMKPSYKKTGVVLIHFGIILVLVGGMLNAYYGKNAEVSISEGDTVNISTIIPTSEALSIHLEQFSIEFNPDGSASQYKSLVVAQRDGNQENKYTISVNHPLKVAGIKAYQQSFGFLIKTYGDFGSDHILNDVFNLGAKINIPDSERQILINDYVPNFNPDNTSSESLRPDNPKIIFSVYEKGELLGVGTVSFGQKIPLSKGKYITFTGIKPFTILKLKSDPGILLAATGGLMLILGVCAVQVYIPYRNVQQNADGKSESEEHFT